MRKFLLLLVIAGVGFGLSVYDIQYSTSGPSPYEDSTVTVTGIVTGSGYDGDKFFIADGEGGPWRGVYVYDYTLSPSPGDWVTFTCEVDEYYGLTELKNLSGASTDSTGSVPPPHQTTCAEADSSEALEGVLITIPNVVISDGTDSLWEVQDSTGALAVARGFEYDFSPTTGDSLESITGIINYSWGEFLLEPRSNDDIGSGGDTITPPPDSSITPIADIQADPDAFVEVTVEGVITAAAGKLRGDQLKAYIQDESGRGIQLFSFSFTAEMESLMVRGALVRASGEVEEYNGVTEIVVDEWVVVGEDTLPAPVNAADVLDSATAFEGTWMSVE